MAWVVAVYMALPDPRDGIFPPKGQIGQGLAGPNMLVSIAAAAMRVADAPLEREDQTGRGAVSEQPAGGVRQSALGGRDARADIDDLALGMDQPRLVGQGTH